MLSNTISNYIHERHFSVYSINNTACFPVAIYTKIKGISSPDIITFAF